MQKTVKLGLLLVFTLVMSAKGLPLDQNIDEAVLQKSPSRRFVGDLINSFSRMMPSGANGGLPMAGKPIGGMSAYGMQGMGGRHQKNDELHKDEVSAPAQDDEAIDS